MYLFEGTHVRTFQIPSTPKTFLSFLFFSLHLTVVYKILNSVFNHSHYKLSDLVGSKILYAFCFAWPFVLGDLSFLETFCLDWTLAILWCCLNFCYDLPFVLKDLLYWLTCCLAWPYCVAWTLSWLTFHFVWPFIFNRHFTMTDLSSSLTLSFLTLCLSWPFVWPYPLSGLSFFMFSWPVSSRNVLTITKFKFIYYTKPCTVELNLCSFLSIPEC